MGGKYWPKKSCKEYKEEYNNAIVESKPVIGLQIDWGIYNGEPSNENNLWYSKFEVDLYIRFIEEAGGQPFILGYSEPAESFKHFLDGFIIAGGRDIDPQHYGEPVDGSIVSPDANIRWNTIERIYKQLPKACPVFGICWGLQFLNVVNGGSLVQDIKDKPEHKCRRKIHLKPSSWFEKVVGPSMSVQCLHHQIINKVGHNVEIVGFDDHSYYPHAIEVKEEGRFIIAVQFHPESTYKNESFTSIDDKNLMIGRKFMEKCTEYKHGRRAPQKSL